MPSAFPEAEFLRDLVDRGVFNADDARELISFTPEQEAILLSLVESDFDRNLVRAAVRFRRQVLEHFDRLVAPPSPTLADPDRAAADYLMACR